MKNPAFIGSIFDVLVGIINIFLVDFIKIQNYHTGVKISKLGREIIEISIISPVQTHKLPFLHGIHRNFNIFPQKCVLRQVLLQFWGAIGEISPISTKFTYFFSFLSVILYINSVGVCNSRSLKTHVIK